VGRESVPVHLDRRSTLRVHRHVAHVAADHVEQNCNRRQPCEHRHEIVAVVPSNQSINQSINQSSSSIARIQQQQIKQYKMHQERIKR